MATVSATTGGVVGPGAAHVAFTATGPDQLTVFPSVGTNTGTSNPPVTSTTTGWVYTARGYFKAPAGKVVCQRIREKNGSTVVSDVNTCATATGAWQQLGPLQYTPTAAGNTLITFLYTNGAVSGDAFRRRRDQPPRRHARARHDAPLRRAARTS